MFDPPVPRPFQLHRLPLHQAHVHLLHSLLAHRPIEIALPSRSERSKAQTPCFSCWGRASWSLVRITPVRIVYCHGQGSTLMQPSRLL